MRIHTMLVGVGCLVIGLLASAFTPRLTAQTTPEPCQAPWDVVIGSERAVKSKCSSALAVTGISERAVKSKHWHAVRWNRCTGETFFYSASRHDRNMNPRSTNPVQ